MISLDELDELDSVEVINTAPDNNNVTHRSHVEGKKGVLYFDLETIPDYERMESFGLDPVPEPKKRGAVELYPPATDVLKQTIEKIREDLRFYNPEDSWLDVIDATERSAAKPRKGIFDLTKELRGQDADRDAAIDQQRKMMSVSPEMNRIVAMGWSINGETKSLVLKEQPHVTEEYILSAFWELAKSAKAVCGYNILSFDLPTIFVRSILLDVFPSRTFDLKPWGTDVIDLMKKRFPSSGAMKLKTLAACLGIPIPAGDVNGAQVEQIFKTDPKKLGEYARSDVDLVKEIHLKYDGLFC